MDAAADVWTFTSWGRPFRLSSSLVDKSSPDTTPVEVEGGWAVTAILTLSGDVLVFWPFGRQFKEIISHKNEEVSPPPPMTEEEEEHKDNLETMARIVQGALAGRRALDREQDFLWVCVGLQFSIPDF